MSSLGKEQLEVDVAGRIGHLIKRVEQVLMAEKAHVLRGFDLTVPQYVTMMALHYVPSQSAAQLARAALVTPQTMSTILGNLEGKGLARRVPSAIHAKVLVTDLTPTGRSLVKKADKYVLEVENQLKNAFTDTEFKQLQSLLVRAESVITTALDEQKSSKREAKIY
ncbi:MarR family winged helix-turn-helix transcriptional regulator [Arthrobacter sp. TMN-49]